MNAIKVIGVTLLAGGISVGTALFGERWFGRESAEPEGVAGGTAPLRTLPDLRLPDLTGREVASTAWAGKVLVIHYWASWCPPCVNELPLLNRAQQELGDQGVQVVGIAVDRAADVRAFVTRYPVNYPILIADPAAVELSRRLGNRVLGIPFTVIFDRYGHRVFSHVGEVEATRLQAQLEHILNGTSGAASPRGADAG
jgi:thiol-disulfide isomerase/thioredoxin